MAVTAKLYGKYFVSLNNKEVSWNSGSIKCALAGSSYSPNQDTDDYWNDVTNEVSGSGYTASGLTLTASSYYTASNNTFTLDLADAIWTSSSLAARYAILYDATPGSAASNPLIGYVDFGEVITSAGGAYTLTWSNTGVINFSTAS